MSRAPFTARFEWFSSHSSFHQLFMEVHYTVFSITTKEQNKDNAACANMQITPFLLDSLTLSDCGLEVSQRSHQPPPPPPPPQRHFQSRLGCTCLLTPSHPQNVTVKRLLGGSQRPSLRNELHCLGISFAKWHHTAGTGKKRITRQTLSSFLKAA